jgi:site-specific DNA-methyltransferase (adenine-specific)
MKYPEDFIDKVIQGDCFEVLKQIPDNVIDTVVTDPPYGIAFKNKEWDYFNDLKQYQEWTRLWALEVLRVAKPGAVMLVFGGSRTWHRMACGIEDAGWEIKDTLLWLYGTGVPKTKYIGELMKQYSIEGAEKWLGYNTTLKPAFEPIVVAMKPTEGSIIENAIKWNVAGFNINETRIPINNRYWQNNTTLFENNEVDNAPIITGGRYPANVIVDEEVASMIDKQSNITKSHPDHRKKHYIYLNDKGGASRFFYVAKAQVSERDAGLDNVEAIELDIFAGHEKRTKRKNTHPTVKPLKLMDYLIKLTKMPNTEQVYLDPFAGSGSTLIAVIQNERHFIGIEKEDNYVKIAEARLKYWSKTKSVKLFNEEV